jgi:hypothetical protein
MVRALMAGTKTQTRRVVKLPSTIRIDGHYMVETRGVGQPTLHHEVTDWDDDTARVRAIACPYGQTGDRLWVREAFAFTDAHEPDYMGSIEYRADNKCLAVDHGPVTVGVPHKCDPRPFDGPWRPSIHMPRWASRITLEINDVRVERLQEISEADAEAEGIERRVSEDPAYWRVYGTADTYTSCPVSSYRSLWESINGTGSWDVNPWVWAISLKRLTP